MTHMLTDFNNIAFKVGNKAVLENLKSQKVLPAYAQITMDFIDDLSKRILRDTNLRKYPEIVAYGYWLRKSTLVRERENTSYLANRMGRGLSYHIAPSNIPIQFAISMIPALLAGNTCAIRISSKEFELADIMCGIIEDVLYSHEFFRDRIVILQYAYNDEITAYLSGICDLRIIWGGDNTIRKIRSYPVSPRAVELTFADRYSISIMDAEVINDSNIENVVNNFWLDSYYVDQNACSSPRIVIWMGKNKEASQKLFWDKLRLKAQNEYKVEALQIVNKLTSMTECAMKISDVSVEESTPILTRIHINDINPKIMDYKCGGGYFFEYECEKMEDILPILDTVGCQSIGVLGPHINEVRDMVFENGVKGVDRIVSVGKMTAPGLKWDGYLMVEAMSRYIEVEETVC